MIIIDSGLFNRVERFLNANIKDYELNNLSNIVVCKRYLVELLNDINEKNVVLAKAFAKANIDYLTGQKDYDWCFHVNANNYLKSLDLSLESKCLIDRLTAVIEKNTYYPIDSSLKEKANTFLNKYDDPSYFVSDDDKKELNFLLNRLEDALYKPRRILDPNYDLIVDQLADNQFEYAIYINKNIIAVIGTDNEAEELIRKFRSLKKFVEEID